MILLALPSFLLACLLAVLIGFSWEDAQRYPSSRWAFYRDAAVQAACSVGLFALSFLIAAAV